MDNLTNIEDIKSLIDDVDNFFTDPNFKPKEQNKYFFSEGTSYYKQLLQVCKIIKLLQTSIKALYSNEEKLKETIEKIDIQAIEDIQKTLSSLDTRTTNVESDVKTLKDTIINIYNDTKDCVEKVGNFGNEIDTMNNTISHIQQTLINVSNNVNKNQNDITILDSEYKAQQETLDDFNTLISNNQGNITSNTTALNKLKSRVDITHNGTCGYVNSNYERKQLTLTTELLDKIKSGDFSDVVCGNYFTLGGHNFSVMGADVLLNTGDTQLTQHHLVIMCDNLYIGTGSALMNDSNTTEGGYQGSKMWKTTIPSIVDELNTLFLNRIISHRELQSNAVSNGAVTNWAWSWNDVKVNIPSEPQVYGCRVFSNGGSNIGNCYSQFPLFRLAPQYICCRQHYWLKDVMSVACFAYVNGRGGADSVGASDTYIGVRPYFLIG